MEDWRALLDAVKEECLSALWSKGVALARAEAVAGEAREEGEWTFRLRVPGDEIAPTVLLYPADAEWDCDCDGPCDPCEHVAACAIAAAKVGGDLDALFSGPGRNARLRYEFRRTRVGLVLERRVCLDDDDGRVLDEPLGEFIEGEGADLAFEPGREDFEVDRLVHPDAPIPFERTRKLLAALVGIRDLHFEGRSVRASAEPIFPRATVSDGTRGGVELTIESDPSVSEIVGPGILRAGDRLHPFGAGARFGKMWEHLPFRRAFGREAFGELVATILPELERHIAIEWRTQRLPGRSAPVSPWIGFEIDNSPEGIDVLPRVVYGNPPVARVERGRLVALGDLVPRRDEPAEKALALRLRDELNLALDRRVRLEPGDAARFFSDLRSFDDGRRVGAGAGDRKDRVELAARLVEGPDGFELVFEPRGGGASTVSAEAVVAAWQQGLALVPLTGGGLADLPTGWLEKHGAIVVDLLAARAANEGKTPRAALSLLGELCAALDSPPPFVVDRAQALVGEGETGHEGIPEGVRDLLRPYQREGVAWLLRVRDAGLGAILADDMGLGKTLQALCALQGRTLVVCPRSIIHNWVKEAQRFRPDLAVSLYHGPGRTLTEADVTITTYATLRNDLAVLSEGEWDTVVLDEAQAIKNPDSQVARAAYSLRGAFRLSLSGTPVENRLDELWSQMHFVNRGLLGGRRDFAERYEKPILAGEARAADRLRARLRPFVLRRLKKNVASELPPRSETVLYCELEPHERTVYDAVRIAARDDVVRKLEDGGNALTALAALLRLRQAACHTGLLPGRDADGSSKVDALCGALEDAVADGHRALVFSQWTGLLDRVEPHLESRSIDFLRLDGSTRDREAIVAGFQDPAGPPVLLISLTAGGTGLNLTAADHVFLLDPWWNPAVEDQAADRAHRIGQERPVMIYRLVSKDTVEERVLELQSRKRQVAEVALGATAAAASITRDDILALLDDGPEAGRARV